MIPIGRTAAIASAQLRRSCTRQTHCGHDCLIPTEGRCLELASYSRYSEKKEQATENDHITLAMALACSELGSRNHKLLLERRLVAQCLLEFIDCGLEFLASVARASEKHHWQCWPAILKPRLPCRSCSGFRIEMVGTLHTLSKDSGGSGWVLL